jgi:hypothetical protein
VSRRLTPQTGRRVGTDTARRAVASPISASWNHLCRWLRALDVHVLGRPVRPPRPGGVATNRREIRPGDLGEDESLHRLANRASIWSSVSSSITRPAATSS